MEIDLIKLQEIYSTLTQCQSLLSRNEYQLIELEKRIRELEQDGIRFESSIRQISEAKKDSVQRFDKYQAVVNHVQTLLEWKNVSDSRMDKLGTSFSSAVATAIVGFVFMAVLFYLSSNKPAKAIAVATGKTTTASVIANTKASLLYRLPFRNATRSPN